MIEKINITSAKYLNDGISEKDWGIKATINGQEYFCGEGSRYYNEIMRQVEAGELTIEEAD